MPPNILGHSYLTENSPGRRQTVEHRVSPGRHPVVEYRRSPLREVFVQERHISPIGHVGPISPPPPPMPHAGMHIMVRKAEHHQDMFI